MRYVERNLRKNEHVAATAHVSYWSIVPIILRSVLFCGIIFSALYYLSEYLINEAIIQQSSDLYQTVTQIRPLILVVAVVAAIIAAAVPIIRLMCIQMVVTDKKLIGKYGVIYVHTLDTYLEKIDNFSINETILGRIFRYNMITVSTTSETLKFKYIARAKAFKNAVMDCYDARLEELMGKQAELVHNRFAADIKVPEGGYVPPVSDDILDDFIISDTTSDTLKTGAETASKPAASEIPETADIEETADVPEDSTVSEVMDADETDILKADEVDTVEDLLAEDAAEKPDEDSPEAAEEDPSEAPEEDAEEEPAKAPEEDAAEILSENLSDTPAENVPETVSDILTGDTSEDAESEKDTLLFKETPVDFTFDDLDDIADESDKAELDDILSFREVTDDFGFIDEPEDNKKD